MKFSSSLAPCDDRKEVIVATITNTYSGEKKNGSFFFFLFCGRRRRENIDNRFALYPTLTKNIKILFIYLGSTKRTTIFRLFICILAKRAEEEVVVVRDSLLDIIFTIAFLTKFTDKVVSSSILFLL